MTAVRIGVIGAGAVGQTVATCLTAAGWCSHLYIASRTEESAAALVADLEDMQQVTGARTRAHVADPADMGHCDAIVVCPRATFTNTARTDVRMAGLAANAPVIAALGRALGGYAGALVVVTNPVDVMAQLLAVASGSRRVYGVGSNTDTARYRLLLADHLHVPVDYVQGHVIGEHGDAAVICASATRVADLPATIPVQHIRQALADRPRRINAGTGRARSGPAGAVLAALRHTLGLDDGVIELSVNHEGTWCGIPLHFTAGTPSVCLPDLTPAETRLLAAARTKIRTAYATVPTHLTRRTPTMTSHATHIAADAHGVTVVSNTRYITDWALRYFGPWWKATPAGTPESGPMVVADIDKDRATEYAQHVADHDHLETVYANARLLYVRDDDGTVTAAQPDDQLAYRADPSGRIHITGSDPVPVALAAARLAREAVRGQLLADGWSILHASAVTRDDHTVLALGDKGAGKTTTALLLAHAGTGWRLLANDRVFVRADNGTVRVLPWPSAAAIGLGLLDALGLYDDVRARVQRGDRLHPTQHQKVTDALLTGSRTPLWNEAGKELKPQFFPDQLAAWLGLDLATEGHAARLLFPRITPAATPALLDEDRPLADTDFFTAGTEDRYPDIFGLAPTSSTNAPVNALGLLAELPRHTLALGYNVTANVETLAQLVDD
ncbi:NAD(P)-binding domain-containing protein [Streptomyces abikoensis]|uniref:lactate/malate family dehydrogenase n=1 Tax=Streptomyces abikoensis TaxID=97398 RepID=UPI0033DD0667